MTLKRIIIDTDCGVDDAEALLVLIHGQKQNLLKIEAIVCTMGNTTLDHVCTNVIRILEVTDTTDIPVYKGAFEALVPPELPLVSLHFGVDGFGDIKFKKTPNINLIKNEIASTAMHDIVIKNSGKITLICLAPLTTVALTAKLYSDFLPNIKEFYIMGGNSQAVGNITPTAEFNFYKDPEAVDIILRGAKCPITILPLETCHYAEIQISNWFDELGKIHSGLSKLMTKVEKAVLNPNSSLWCPYDAFLAVALLYPKEAIEEQLSHFISIELCGNKTRGQVVVDHFREKEPNVTIIERLKDIFFLRTMIAALQQK